MSIVITQNTHGIVSMAADTQETSLMTGNKRVMYGGKIVTVKTSTPDEVALIGVVGNANQFGLLKYIATKARLSSSAFEDVFDFFATFYEEANERNHHVFGDNEDTYSEFHVAFKDCAWLVRGLTIEPINTFATSGSGADLATGALLAGATVNEALQIACQENAFCSFPIDVWEVENDQFIKKRYDQSFTLLPDKSH